MTGPEHYREAERLVKKARSDRFVGYGRENTLAAAQVHATLALAAATAAEQATKYDGDEYGRRSREWAGVA